MAPDAFFTFLYLKSKKILEKPKRYGPQALPKLKKPFYEFRQNLWINVYFWFYLNCIKANKNKKKYRRHKIDVKFSAESIPTVRISIYIDSHLEIFDFLLIFDFLASPYFLPLFWVRIWILREILHGIYCLENFLKNFCVRYKIKMKN